MSKSFNVVGTCYPKENYMVDMGSRLNEIGKLVDEKKYFTINRARQYGKTTLLNLMVRYLSSKYTVFSVSFEGLGDSVFEKESSFCSIICRLLYDAIRYGEVPALEDPVKNIIYDAVQNNSIEDLFGLSTMISDLCGAAKRPIVLMIDEVDQASGYKVFLDFLGMLRSKYLKRTTRPVFQSVILAGVYDIKNLKQRIRNDEEHQYNSPWNMREGNESNECLHSFDDCPRDHRMFAFYDIAADFLVDMSFHAEEIASMLKDYEADHHTGMDIAFISQMLYEYTSGYPYLVSRLCQLIDERVAGGLVCPDKRTAWTKEGILEAVRIILREPNTLFDDMIKHLYEYSRLSTMLKNILFQGRRYTFETDTQGIQLGMIFGFLKEQNQAVCVANRIFETKLYNFFLSEEEGKSDNLSEPDIVKNQFIVCGMLQMEFVMRKFYEYFENVFANQGEKFLEEEGRRIFLMFLRPIINGAGNYYIESQTRDKMRTDVIVDYKGQRFVIELKLWRGQQYQNDGQIQLAGYLEQYQQDRGYLLTFNFNKNKKTGIWENVCKGKKILEVIV